MGAKFLANWVYDQGTMPGAAKDGFWCAGGASRLEADPERYPDGNDMNTTTRMILGVMLLGSTLFAHGHGNVTPQGVDLHGLELLGDEWRDTNPYRAGHPQHALAVDIGQSAYNQNCAACHGLEAKSGGIAPDLRELENGDYGDEWYKERVVNGAVRDGRVLMPKMADYLSQEALWAIRTWLETVSLQTTGQ